MIVLNTPELEFLLIKCAGAHRWRSYFTSGSSAIYLFLYSAFYFYTKLDITKVNLLADYTPSDTSSVPPPCPELSGPSQAGYMTSVVSTVALGQSLAH